MKAFCILLSLCLVTTASSESLRLILVPQQLVAAKDGSTTKFDVYLYNDSDKPQTVPSLESFRALYTVRRHGDSDTKSESYSRKFSHPIKDHVLQAHRVDHATIDVSLTLDDGDFLEVHLEIGDKELLTSNSVLLLCRQP
jgi:hypothetical protein